jgi:uncharacterized protein (UPF0332 family)
VRPESQRHLEKARECLRYARTNLESGLTNDAGRNAYLVQFHAAQALIFDRTGKVAKTHSGVHTEFNRLALQEPGMDSEFRRLLPHTYNLKAVADYETGPDSVIPHGRAAEAVESAGLFVARIANALSSERDEDSS